MVLALVALAAAAGLIADLVGHQPAVVDRDVLLRVTNEFGEPVVGPSSEYYFGVDQNGRDVFIRTVFGTRTSLLVGLGATGLAVLIGVLIGLIAGYFGGVVDTVISRSIDIFLSLPTLLFAVGIVAACGTTATGCLGGLIEPGRLLVMVIISLFTWPYIARIVRGNTLSLREKEFIEAARSLGATDARIMAREVLPNLVAPIIVYATLLIPSNILFEAALSFLGLVPKDVISWGGALSEASSTGLYRVAWWLMLFPGLFLLLTTLAFNLLGDGLRDALNPRSAR